MAEKFARTALTLVVHVDTQFGPHDAYELVSTLLNVPAVKSVQCTQVFSNYRLHQPPADVLDPVTTPPYNMGWRRKESV